MDETLATETESHTSSITQTYSGVGAGVEWHLKFATANGAWNISRRYKTEAKAQQALARFIKQANA